ncbi:MAG: IS3 family transposase, partial [Betaproteobacteria bacterium]|nr:IS3 family transposase [Betaproteobacteria bacterium]
ENGAPDGIKPIEWRLAADIVAGAPAMARFRERPGPGLMHRSGRGGRNASHAFQDNLKGCGMTRRTSRKGNCRDNAPTESRSNSFKNGRVHGIRYTTRAEMKAARFEYTEVFYNRKRQHPAPGYRSPTQCLGSWISKQHQGKLVA